MVFVSKTPSKKFHSNLTNEKLTGFLSLFPNSLTLHLRRLLFVRYIYIVVCFLFLVFNLSIGANGCASKRQWVYEWTLKTLSNCALEPVCSKVYTMESSWKTSLLWWALIPSAITSQFTVWQRNTLG